MQQDQCLRNARSNRVARHQVLERLGPEAEAATAFFGSYGAQVGPIWRAFLDRMEEECRTDADAVVRMAAATFESLSGWLFRERSAAETARRAGPIQPSRAP